MKVKIGILGIASIAKRMSIKAFQNISNAEVVSVASRDIEKAKDCAEKFGIRSSGSYEELLNDPDVDAVYIPLPIGLHKEWIIRAVKVGKHVISEKSLTGDLRSTQEVVEECRKAGIVLYENFMCDFHPQHAKVQSMIERGDIGESAVFRGYFGFPRMGEDNFRYDKDLGGGSLNDAGAYTIFMARKMLCAEPIAVTARLHTDNGLGVDMRGEVLMEFPNDRSAFIAFSFDALYQNNYSIWGSRGLISVDRAYSIPPDMKPEVTLTHNDGQKEIRTSIDIEPDNQFELIFQDFCDTIINKEERKDKIDNTYEKLIAQAKTLEAIRISSTEERRVIVSEVL